VRTVRQAFSVGFFLLVIAAMCAVSAWVTVRP
jgi:hypothetical protein